MKNDILTSTFIRLRSRLRGLASGIAGDDNADDAIHDAFCRLWAGHHLPADETEAMKLVYTSVRNAAIDKFRGDKVRRATTIDELIHEPAAEKPDSESQTEIYNRVVEMSRRVLNEKQYRIFRMHDIEGAAYDDIADEMGMTPENVRVTLSRARKTIREIYRRTNDK